ncbi:MAG: hypothetical protein J6A22_01880 [Bacteroidales bacterium]|nr:hypothetical protein [Bacteroidales bacterium]
MKNKIYIFLLIALSAICVACQKDSGDAGLSEGADAPASLVLNLEIPKIDIDVKSISDYPDDPSRWTVNQRVIDGRLLYRVVCFIFKETEVAGSATARYDLVAFRDVYYENRRGAGEGTGCCMCDHNGFWDEAAGAVGEELKYSDKVQFTFNYDLPKHGSIEKLKRGDYRIMVIANFSDFKHGESVLGGVDGGRLEAIVDTVEADFKANPEEGIQDILNPSHPHYAQYYKELFDHKVDTGDDRIVYKDHPSTLTLNKLFEMQAGMNELNGELVRTRSRIRISVKNESSDELLEVNKLEFSDLFSQKSTYLYKSERITDRNYELFANTRGPLEVDSQDALVPFDETVKIEAGKTAVVFDAYILGSKIQDSDPEGGYHYTLGLNYPNSVQTHYALQSSTSINTRASLNDDYGNGSDAYYLIYNTQTGRYLRSDVDGSASGNYVHSATYTLPSVGVEVPVEYVWKLEKSTTYQYYIREGNLRDSYYWGTPTTNNVPLGVLAQNAFTFSDDSNNILMRSNGYSGGNRYYMSVNTDGSVRGTRSGNARRFRFYPVTLASSTAAANLQIPLETIDPVTSQSTPIEAIRRNDFINILVTVTYNRDKGKFEFVVKDWEETSADIEFN